MLEPKPGEPFEFAGLTWEPSFPGNKYDRTWDARLPYGSHDQPRRFVTVIDIVRPLHGPPFWVALHDRTEERFETAEAAIRWVIRTCPAVKCGSCAHWSRDPLDADEDGRLCLRIARHEPADGFCHEWEAGK